MKFTKKQLLNITTGRLYTNMDDIYSFFDSVIEEGIMTHMLPNARKAILPIMETKYPDLDYTRTFNPDIVDGDKEYEIEFTKEEKALFWKNYSNLPSTFEKKS